MEEAISVVRALSSHFSCMICFTLVTGNRDKNEEGVIVKCCQALFCRPCIECHFRSSQNNQRHATKCPNCKVVIASLHRYFRGYEVGWMQRILIAYQKLVRTLESVMKETVLTQFTPTHGLRVLPSGTRLIGECDLLEEIMLSSEATTLSTLQSQPQQSQTTLQQQSQLLLQQQLHIAGSDTIIVGARDLHLEPRVTFHSYSSLLTSSTTAPPPSLDAMIIRCNERGEPKRSAAYFTALILRLPMIRPEWLDACRNSSALAALPPFHDFLIRSSGYCSDQCHRMWLDWTSQRGGLASMTFAAGPGLLDQGEIDLCRKCVHAIGAKWMICDERLECGESGERLECGQSGERVENDERFDAENNVNVINTSNVMKIVKTPNDNDSSCLNFLHFLDMIEHYFSSSPFPSSTTQ